LADHDAYILRRELHRRNPKAIDERSIWRLQEKRYYEGYFLELLGLKRPLSYSHAPDGTPTWWERKANNQYDCSACHKMISKGQRYIGCRELSPGMHGPYGYRGTYITDCYHIVCLLKAAQTKAESEIQNASSEIRELRNQISSFKDIKSQRKKQIEYCETAKQKAKREYESSKSWRRLVKWVGHKYTSWSKNGEIQSLEREIIHIENREIPVRENRINELLGRINHSRTRQTRLKEESREFLNLTERMKRT
jgi:hypothetical protein